MCFSFVISIGIVFLIQAFDFELYMYGVAGSLLGKVLNATETTTLASK
jgi:hypothetical protein